MPPLVSIISGGKLFYFRLGGMDDDSVLYF